MVVREKSSSLVFPFSEWKRRFESNASFTRYMTMEDDDTQFCKYTVPLASDRCIYESDLREIEKHLEEIKGVEIEAETLAYWEKAKEMTEKRLKMSENITERFVDTRDLKSRSLDEFFFLFQSFDGQLVFLSSFCMKMLQSENKELPESMRVKILDLDWKEQQNPPKFRFAYFCFREIFSPSLSLLRFLSHLPEGSNFAFCEVDLSGVVSGDTLKAFDKEIRKRNNERKRRANKQAALDKR